MKLLDNYTISLSLSLSLSLGECPALLHFDMTLLKNHPRKPPPHHRG